MDEIRLGVLTTLWPSSTTDATLATTTVTTKPSAEAVETIETHQVSSPASLGEIAVGRRDHPTFLLLFGQALPLVLLATVTVVSNLMVLFMFRVKRSLRSCKNMYLASLALADLLIGGCMYVAILQQLRGKGPVLQPGALGEAYHVIRQAALYVSLLSLMLITVDRWWSIHHPFSYRAKRRKRNAAVAVGTVWLLGFAIHIVPVVIWNVLNPSAHAATADEVSSVHLLNNNLVYSTSSNAGVNSTSSADDNDTLSLSLSTALVNASKPFLSNHSAHSHSELTGKFLEPTKYIHHVQRSNITEQNKNSQSVFSKSKQGLPLFDGLPVYNKSPLVSLAWDVQYLLPLLAMLSLNCSLYVGILGRKRIQIRRSLTSFNRLSTSITDRRNSVSSVPNFYCEASSSLDENAELLLSNGKSGDTDSGGEGGNSNKTKEGANGIRTNSQRSTASITNLNTKFNFYTSSTTTYKQLQQHYHQTKQTPSTTLRPSVSMPQVHLSSIDNTANLADNKTLTTPFNNNNKSGVPNGMHPNSTQVQPFRRFSWAPRKSSLALNRRSKGSEELAKDLLVRQDRKAACWLGLLVVVFLACWLPHSILRVICALNALDIPPWMMEASIWIQLANSTINPMLYGFFNKEIREAFKQWMNGGSRKKRAKFKSALLLNGNITPGAGSHSLNVRRMSLFDTVHE
ncbi:hypothetical protein EGW08_010756 [Elysia chlorotica]|uniref:G-protein coupled receptors family 1 profile domain-containing protein n=1 Tax=Elysia chlorotica TaxID=188477 RepID=A0A3S0ZL41_ELYCH|nr:hypothetical protein EGW08_010756 [Elysia chlorotica]